MNFKNFIISIVIAIILPNYVHGQQIGIDSLSTNNKRNYQFEWKQTILPASLIGVRAIALAPNFWRKGSRAVTYDVINLRANNKRIKVDDYIQYLPVVGTLTMDFVGIKAKHSFRDRVLITATSYATLGIITNVAKHCINEKRPEFNSHNSFPSGHTATVFMGAELVRIEYGGWYGAGAYAIAVGVGFLRMYNGRHWLHDIIAGAGVGILSARVGEWSAKLWQRAFPNKKEQIQNIAFSPIIIPTNNGYYGLCMGHYF
jgi:membrane-associated phospholipid phosphatase